MKILIVDDSMGNAVSLKNLLGRVHEVRIENTLASAIKTASEFFPDVVVCDAGLTDSGAMDTARLAPPAFAPTPVIIWSGIEDEELVAESFASGASDFLVKAGPNHPVQRILFAHLRNLYVLSKHEK